ncbi:MAG: hypothetical protein ONB33_12265 [candidate division KSB1 bacterium]|nr:hypothetical protein [candidate division KSB1 bacterium]MDZ7358364.1 hypothetical protein [candidate division KSB1 bacterium]MDZ7401951.1 hypothetical protein [candidate division KSB1 bacterium]
MNQKLLSLLYRSFDGQLSPAEQKQLDQALSDSAALRAEKNRIEQLRSMISHSGHRTFRPFFAEKVIQKIRDYRRPAESFVDSLITVFRPVAIAVTILLVVLLSYNLFMSEDKSLSSAFAEPEIKLEQALDPAIVWAME